MNVSLITSVPVVPPWDQGDKNLAYTLTATLPHICFQVLTSRNDPPPAGENLQRLPLYDRRRPDLRDKTRVWAWLLGASFSSQRRSRLNHGTPDLYHLIYHPNLLSSVLLKGLPEFSRRPSLHTVPATASGNPLAANLFFSDRVVALSEHGRQALQALGLRDVHHIPPGIDVDRWAALSPLRDRLKDRLGLSGKPVLLYPGHFGLGYGCQVLLQALRMILPRVPQTQLVFACRIRNRQDRKQEAIIREEIQVLGLEQTIHLYDTVSDMRHLIGASDLVLLPFLSMRDKVDIPTTLLEALAAGKPIVISDLPPMRELLASSSLMKSPDRMGVLVPPGDAQALADEVVALLLDSDLRERMGRQGQRLVRAQYDIRLAARQYERLYLEMVP